MLVVGQMLCKKLAVILRMKIFCKIHDEFQPLKTVTVRCRISDYDLNSVDW